MVDKGRTPNSGRKAERQPRPQPLQAQARKEALMRRMDAKFGDGGRKPVGKQGTGQRPAPGVGPARPMTLEERSGRFLSEGKN